MLDSRLIYGDAAVSFGQLFYFQIGIIMLELLLVLVLLVIFWNPLVMNTLGPIIIWRTQKIPAEVRFRPVDETGFLLARNEEFKRYDRELTALNFDVQGSSILEDSQTKSYFRLYWDKENFLAATVVSMESKLEEVTYVEFSQIYEDGSVLDVNNSKKMEVYPEIEFKKVFNFFDIRSVSELLKCFNKVKGKLRSDTCPVSINTSRHFSDIERFIRKESDALTSMGFLKEPIDAEGWRSLTLAGALSMTWRSVPPGSKIVGYFKKKRQEKLLGEI